MAKDFFRVRGFSKTRIFWYLIVLITMGIMFLKLKNFKESKTTKADSTTPEQALTTSIATDSSYQPPKLQMPEKADSTVRNAVEEDDVSSTNHNWEYLRYSMRRDSENITVTKNADGSSTAFLNGTFRSVSAAKRLPDGRLVTRCFESFDALEKFMTSTATESAVMESE